MQTNKPEITLSPWEVAPNFEPASVELESFSDIFVSSEGAKRPAGTAKCPINDSGFTINFLQFLDEDEDGNWVFVDNGYLQKAGEPYNAGFSFRSSYGEGQHANLGRLFNACALGYGEDESLFISVGSVGVAAWFSTRRDYKDAPFTLKTDLIGGSIYETPLSIIKAALQKELLDPDSDIHFALKWANTSEDEKFSTVYRTKRGDWEQFAELLHAVELLFFAVNKDDFFFNESDYSYFYHSYNGSTPDKVVRRRRRWNLELVRYFEPFIADELCENNVVFSWASRSGRFRKVKSVSPSAHDELEAASLLYNWAHDNMPSKKLKLLLPY